MAENTEESTQTKKKIPLLMIVLGFQLVVLLGAVGFLAKINLAAKGPDVSLNSLREKAIESIQDDVAQVETVEIADVQANLPGSHVIKTKLQIEVSNAQTKAYLERRSSAIKARIIEVLASQTKEMTATFQGKLLLKDAVREAINQELVTEGQSSGVVRDVYFMDIILI